MERSVLRSSNLSSVSGIRYVDPLEPQFRPKRKTYAWMRGVSIPSALLGVLGFFLPWFEFSCGPIRLTMSGYELATGSWPDKFSPAHADEFWGGVRQQVGTDLNHSNHALARRERHKGGNAGTPSKPDDKPQKSTRPREAPKVPALWAIPAACLGLLLLSFFGLPRAPTIIISALAGAYLAYFAITTEQAANDFAVTGGVLQHGWLFGLWASCIGLLLPSVFALVKPK